MSKHRQLWEMIREDVRRQFDYSQFVLPDEWAKDWPEDLTNFWIDKKGGLLAILGGRGLCRM